VLIWAPTPLIELEGRTGYVEVEESLAAELLAHGAVQDPRIGAVFLRYETAGDPINGIPPPEPPPPSPEPAPEPPAAARSGRLGPPVTQPAPEPPTARTHTGEAIPPHTPGAKPKGKVTK